MANKDRLVSNNALIDEAIQIANTLPDILSNIRKEVNFYDYDGTLLYGYTVEQVQSLTALPPLPTHDGLTCQGWNYDLATIKSYNAPVDVGALYITDDGKTRLYIRIASDGRMTVPLVFTQSDTYGVTIDWGDGSASQTFRGEDISFTEDPIYEVTAQHTYLSIGDYIITLSTTDTCQLELGSTSNNTILGANNTSTMIYRSMLQKVEIGRNVTYVNFCALKNCVSCHNISIPDSVSNIYDDTFKECYSLHSVVIPEGITEIYMNEFYDCKSLFNVNIPNSVTTIESGAFSGCTALRSIVIPRSVQNIDNYAFNSCGVSYYDFTSHTSIPTLGTGVFNVPMSDYEIRVPSYLYLEWISATNWSAYADHIAAIGDDVVVFYLEDEDTNTLRRVCCAQKGMTWAQWCGSAYDIEGYYCDENSVVWNNYNEYISNASADSLIDSRTYRVCYNYELDEWD